MLMIKLVNCTGTVNEIFPQWIIVQNAIDPVILPTKAIMYKNIVEGIWPESFLCFIKSVRQSNKLPPISLVKCIKKTTTCLKSTRYPTIPIGLHYYSWDIGLWMMRWCVSISFGDRQFIEPYASRKIGPEFTCILSVNPNWKEIIVIMKNYKIIRMRPGNSGRRTTHNWHWKETNHRPYNYCW